MPFLKLLESVRTPFLDRLAAYVTLLGEETVFMLAGLALVWCVNKRWGFRLLFAGLLGNTLNQLLKAIFLIPRPWVIDPGFTIVESARAAATGYSFPSGHTQTAATVFGMLAEWAGRRRVTACCVLATLLVGFSRMYLGVHTPLDVCASLLTGALTVVLTTRLFARFENGPRGRRLLSVLALGFPLVLLGYVLFMPARGASIAEFDAHGVKNAWTLLGAMSGVLLAWRIDHRYTHFETRAVWWAQLLKLALGLGLVLAVRVGAKPLLSALWGDAPFTHGLRYLLTAVAGGVLWPMTFRFWSGLGSRRQAAGA